MPHLKPKLPRTAHFFLFFPLHLLLNQAGLAPLPSSMAYSPVASPSVLTIQFATLGHPPISFFSSNTTFHNLEYLWQHTFLPFLFKKFFFGLI